EEGELTFDMSLEIMPEIPELDYSKLTLERLTYEVDPKEIDEGIARLAERNKQYNKLDAKHKAMLGNVVEIDFKGFHKGEPFAGGEAKNVRLELGSNQFIPGFEDQLVGVKEGDKLSIDVTFPKDYHKEDLAGEKTTFEIVVHG